MSNSTPGGKGSARRKEDAQAFASNYDRIFRKAHPDCPQPEVCAEPFCSCDLDEAIKRMVKTAVEKGLYD